MIKGAKRYILSPPKACSKLGIVPEKKHPIFRHSLLNFGHIKYLQDAGRGQGMSKEERKWLERASTAPAVETVLKAGEVLYVLFCISVKRCHACSEHGSYSYDFVFSQVYPIVLVPLHYQCTKVGPMQCPIWDRNGRS